jgi:CYTH domain-containing protein
VSGKENIYKLTQKYRSETQDAHETTITNIYLNETEYNHLKGLEAKILRKRRYPYTVQDGSLSIDVFEDRHQGLILAEIELENQAQAGKFVLPSFVLREVTDDPFFAGGNLVMTDEEFKQGLARRLGSHENLG